MTEGGTSRAHRSLGIGDHTPIFSCPDCEGGLFDLYSDVKGQPTVMVFLGVECLKEKSEKNILGVSPPFYSYKLKITN